MVQLASTRRLLKRDVTCWLTGSLKDAINTCLQYYQERARENSLFNRRPAILSNRRIRGLCAGELHSSYFYKILSGHLGRNLLFFIRAPRTKGPTQPIYFWNKTAELKHLNTKPDLSQILQGLWQQESRYSTLRDNWQFVKKCALQGRGTKKGLSPKPSFFGLSNIKRINFQPKISNVQNSEHLWFRPQKTTLHKKTALRKITALHKKPQYEESKLLT